MSPPTVLITGGAGFVGCNLANRLLEQGSRVVVLDSLKRARVRENLDWLHGRHGGRLEVDIGDVRDAARVAKLVRGVDQVFHFAAQVAVTTSVEDPVEDFEVNARGSLNVLEAIRATSQRPSLVFASTNKVYGRIGDLDLVSDEARYTPASVATAGFGISEDQPLQLYSPYGCSKGAADQYVLDYARIYGLRTAVFRMSCLYGPRQFGTEDQGWVAHFLISALAGRPITIFGDGRQVRDVLYVDDVLDAFCLAQAHMEKIVGQAFNIGGGPRNAVSLRDVLVRIERLLGRKPETSFDEWRPGDQAWYVSDIRRFSAATGWAPKVDAEDGIGRLAGWLKGQMAPAPEAAPEAAVA